MEKGYDEKTGYQPWPDENGSFPDINDTMAKENGLGWPAIFVGVGAILFGVIAAALLVWSLS